MRYAVVTLALGVLLAAPVCAGAAPGQAVAAPGARAVQLRETLQQRDAELKRLQHRVSRQEARSRQASQRLQRQDQTIADLQRQLKALHAAEDHPSDHP